MKKLFSFLSSRLFISLLLIAAQLAAYFFMLFYLNAYSSYIRAFMLVISCIFVVYVADSDINPSFKISWIIALLILPFFSWVLFLIFGRRKVSRNNRKYYASVKEHYDSCRKNDIVLPVPDAIIARQCRFIVSTSDTAVFSETTTRLFICGEDFFPDFILSLNGAEKFIFLEYFIVSEGKMWTEIFNILKFKVQSGVEVRLMYDDLGTISLLSKDFRKSLEAAGISVCVFNPLRPSPDVFLNYRDHRKIAVIDGKIGYTGGLNLSDEYINFVSVHGYWKDYAVKICGSAVSVLTRMFLEMWDYSTGKISDSGYDIPIPAEESDGYVIPFGDGPMGTHLTGEMSYINILSASRRYVYIITPYLILDNEMITALRLAAKSGIDVRIITPHIPDKWYVHAVTKANYPSLVSSGVKIYEYTLGFIHAKSIVSDDSTAIIGTVNFDFRSFYLHFENGIFFYKSSVVSEAKSDFLGLIPYCIEITQENLLSRSVPKRLFYSFMRLFSPFM